ncbi:hypothetical protein UFOVP161_15 [uncultured Caudovirales phage]|uniref:Uncharacterized protein n=1 Tax=uncultured Caudovirales phage TaxID=2100421 RepID=A0A6J7W9G2_9CAUD|nr:hypothetical protein UFOVP161_15 [uncultured Caudovirales phage]
MNLARRAVKLFPFSDYTTRQSVIHTRKAWLRSILTLGDKWLLANANRVR